MKEEMRESFEAWHNTEGKTAIESEQYYEDVAKDYAFCAWQHQQAKIDSLQANNELLQSENHLLQMCLDKARQPVSITSFSDEQIEEILRESQRGVLFASRAKVFSAIRSILERK